MKILVNKKKKTIFHRVLLSTGFISGNIETPDGSYSVRLGFTAFYCFIGVYWDLLGFSSVL